MSILFLEILSYSVITSIAISQIHVVGNEVKQMANVYLPLFSASEAIRRDVQGKQLYLKEVIFVGDRVVYDQEAEETYIAARSRFLSAATSIENLIQLSSKMISDSVDSDKVDFGVIGKFKDELQEQLSRVRLSNRLNDRRVELVFQYIEDGSFLMGMELLEEVSKSEAALLNEIENLEGILITLKSASLEYTVSVERASSLMTLLASILNICIVITTFYFVVKRNISHPLDVLTEAISSFDLRKSESNFHPERALMFRGDELGMLARSFDALKGDLRLQEQALRLSKESAERADRAKTQFLAAASHDLRQPLHAMRMYLAALKYRLEDKKNQEIAQKIEDVSIAFGGLLNSLLDISQLEAGGIKPQYKNYPITGMLRRLSLAFQPLAFERGLDLRFIPSSVVVRSDPALLERIVSNFISNALSYTERGKVVVGCRRRGDNIAIQVLDSGMGIPEDKLDQIFDDFFQLHNTERDRGKGLGLGLGIARRLSYCLGHRIEYRSILGVGSCFGVVVPVGLAAAEPEIQADMFSYAYHQSRISLMLLEDDEAVAEAMIMLLNEWGFKVIWASDSGEALTLMTSSTVKPQIILADYRLPGEMDGVQAVAVLQRMSTHAIPTIIMTGESELGELREISELGYVVLRKPVHPAELRSLICKIILKT